LGKSKQDLKEEALAKRDKRWVQMILKKVDLTDKKENIPLLLSQVNFIKNV